jgi:hypothetical protein
MAITTGAATTDNIFLGGNTLSATGPSVVMVWGWIKVNTFTSGRSINNVLKLDGTTELRFVVTRLTTATELVTTTAGITVGEWVFVCTAAISTTTAHDSSIWVGRAETPPTLMTLTTAVGGSGNFSGTGLSVLGNLTSSGTTAFQGTSDGWGGISTGDTITGAGSPFNISSFTALTADDDRFLLDRFVIPAWLGQAPKPVISNGTISSGRSGQYVTGQSPPYMLVDGTRRTTVTSLAGEATVTGTVTSQERCPRAVEHIDFPYLRR